VNPRLRLILYGVAGCIVAVITGVDLANESYALVTALFLFSAWLVVTTLSDAKPDAWVMAAILVGYVVGNRGFAQFQPMQQVPILPAEALLIVTVPALVARAVLARRTSVSPWKPVIRNDALNFSIIVWIVIGTLRMPRDVSEFGATAVRDFATVYYSVLFFVAQEFGGDTNSRKVLIGAFTLSFALLIPVVVANYLSPDFLLDHTVVLGIPLIFHKSDLIATSLACGFFWFWTRTMKGRRSWFVMAGISLALIGAMQSPRSGMAGVFIVTLLWVVTGRWRIAVAEVGVVALASVVVLAVAIFSGKDLTTTAPYSAFEHAKSIFDPAGTGTYINAESGDPGGNNQFRLIWWRDVIEDTISIGPIYGQGFGADLSTRFLADYDLLNDETFAARSPHSVVMTIFGRMGFLGLAAWIAVSASTLGVAWKLIKLNDADSLGLGSVVIVIWLSSAVGVVLEGPMGAVPFWTALGLANAELARRKAIEDSPTAGNLQPEWPVAKPAPVDTY
jgi:hypothetical protein